MVGAMKTFLFAIRVCALVIALIAAILVYGGYRLAVLGGSPYYVLAGLGLAVTSFLLWQCRREGTLLFAGLTLVTIAWSIGEVGFTAWSLMPRVVTWLVVGAFLMLRPVRERLVLGPGVERFSKYF